ncbi:indole-3-glycerol phosphate synthase [Caldanaerobius fijiensis DSM 17918]|uniref:Indole-3-glycerol phosphate synthase n=1 Tax=Caldanaerobius fijiensis DSM 17918 TaxID=1121256 RepID=A0A1M4TAF0_9THEO|nr:indole-3-glycerol phosphate synthase TrpC [Caldanaerobius fijiensis]SHE41499.1 indole-3-glycerol phosphate synthase [Caldanaerobius fijiensis DSM 17918]
MILDEIVAYKKLQLEEEKRHVSIDTLMKAVNILLEDKGNKSRGFKCALLIGREDISMVRNGSIKIIAEIKKASPSKGAIKEDIIPADIARMYEAGGADAISVLTEKKYFLGDDSFIGEVKNAVALPVLRKDFIIDEYQIYQSKVIGADAVLLITAILGKNLKRYYGLAKSLDLDCLVEVHDEGELDIALETGADVIGINNRNLKDFTVNLKNTEKLIKMIPQNVVKVSESGIRNPDDIKYLRSIGVDAVLIGEALMRSKNIIKSLEELKMA